MEDANLEHANLPPPDTSRHEATIDDLLPRLQSLYWDGVKREIGNMILALSEINKFHPKPLSSENYGSADVSLGSKNYQSIFRLWSPKFSSEDTYKSVDDLCGIAEDSARERLTMDLGHRRARSLLQSSGLLDVDLVHEYTDPSVLRQHQHRPRSETVIDAASQSKMYRAIRCRSCCRNIRAKFYFECQRGCKDDLSPRFPSQSFLNKKGSVNNLTIDSASSLAPVRLCPLCVVKLARYSPCDRTHLKRVWARRAESRQEKTFRNRLHQSEGGSRERIGNPVVRALGKTIDPGHIVPAGPLHVAIMYGPLLFEIGIPNTSGGVSITQRPPPSLCFQPTNAFLYPNKDRQTGRPETQALVLFQMGEQRFLRLSSEAQRDRQLLASAKRIYGGAFSGRDAGLHQMEEAVASGLMTASEHFEYLPSKSVRANYERLQAKAAKVTSLVRKIINHDVDQYLTRFSAALLDPKLSLRWNARSNTCQDFTENILRDPRLGALAPKLPKAFVTDENVRVNPAYPGLRYVVNFGATIDTPIALLRPQPRSVIWRFYHETRDVCDLIEYAECVAQKQASIPRDLQRVSVLQYPEPAAGASVDDLIDSLWELPRDTLSTLQMHLLRQREKYSSSQGYALTEGEWVADRLRILQQLDVFGSFAGAWASVWLAEFLRKPDGLLLKGWWPDAATYGTMHVSERVQTTGTRWCGLGFITGREREWWKRELYYQFSKIRASCRW